MHRLLVIGLKPESAHKFRIVADSANPNVSHANSGSIAEAGGSEWSEFDEAGGYSSPYATIPCRGAVIRTGFWYVNKTGKTLTYDFAQFNLSELKVVTSGELHVEYAGRTYVAHAGDSMLYLVDPDDRQNGTIRPYEVKFLGDHDCTVAFTEFPLA